MQHPLLSAKAMAPSNSSSDKEEDDDEEEEDRHKKCFGRVLSWLWSWRPSLSSAHSHANTVMMLKNVMIELSLAIASAEHHRTVKCGEICELLARSPPGDKTAREMARLAMQNVKQYDAHRLQWFKMRENVETLKAELVAQQQSLSVFQAFNRANAVMENIAKQLNVAALEKTLSSLQDKLDSGREISDLFSTALVNGQAYDPDELDQELAQLVQSSSSSFPVAAAPAPAGEKGKEEEQPSPLPAAKKEASRKEKHSPILTAL